MESMTLDHEEYVEQAYFYHTLRQRMEQGTSTQELLLAIRQELLSTTKLPLALDFMGDELKHSGVFGPAMARLQHYFTPFQSFVIQESERAEGKFDFRVALEILEREADYRAKGCGPQGIFLYQFEALCRNRLGYDKGLEAIAGDPIFDESWREWIFMVRRQVGLIDFGDMIFVRSEHYRRLKGDPEKPILFGEKEGKIALANRKKDPLYLFSALARHLGYPSVPRPKPPDQESQRLYAMQRRLERLETRLRLVEEELRGGINISRFYVDNREPKPEGGEGA
jgi:hypothetical protein